MYHVGVGGNDQIELGNRKCSNVMGDEAGEAVAKFDDITSLI